MARTLSIPEQNYTPGNYGPFSVDSFTKNDTSFIEVKATVVGWPTASPLFILKITWNTGEFVEFVQSWPVTNAKTGLLLTECVFRANVPVDINGKRNVTSGNITATVNQTFSTALTIQAL